MRKEELSPRFYGSEIEYAYTKTVQSTEPRQKIKQKKLDAGQGSSGFYLRNGSRVYIDVGSHPEYATPECETLDELVTHELAGEEIIWEAFGNVDGRTDGLQTVHKRCISTDISEKKYTSGAHENYSTTLKWQANQILRENTLAVHFATRTVFIGAGQSTREGYMLGQKMEDITARVGNGSTSNKALVNTRNEPHNGNDSRINRLHVVSGDANMSPWAIRMKFGTTSLVLRLLEQGVDVSDLFLQNPLDAAHRNAGDVEGMTTAFPSIEGKSFTALNSQEELANRVHSLSERVELPPEELDVLDDWFATVDALKKYSSGKDLDKASQHIMEQMDWYTKKERLDRLKKKREEQQSSTVDSHMLDLYYELKYDQIPDGTGVRLRKNRFGLYAPSDVEIQKAKTTPPEGRAKLRGAIVERETKDRKITWDVFNKKRMQLGGDYSDEGIKTWLDTNL